MKDITYLMMILIVTTIVNAGVTLPNQLKINAGEEADFNFAIDAILSNDPLNCKIEFESQTPLKIIFEKVEIMVEVGRREFVKGLVKVPKSLEVGFYQENFCVSCERVGNLSGAVTKPRYCDIPIRVTVENVAENLTEGKLEEWVIKNIFSFLLIFINVILIVIVTLLYIKNKSKKRS